MTFQLRINLGKQHDKLFPRTLVLAVLSELAEILNLTFYINNLSIHIPFFHSFLILLPVRISHSILRFGTKEDSVFWPSSLH